MTAIPAPGPGTAGDQHPVAVLAAAAREVNRLVRVTAADDEALARATALLRDAAGVLAGATHDGPLAQTGFDDLGLDTGLRPDQFFPYSPVVGPRNPVAPPVALAGDEDGHVRGTVTLTDQYNGPPWDLAHGGIIALIFDELLGLAAILGAGGGFTGRLTVRYHKPTPLRRELALHAWVDQHRGRKITVKGTMTDGDVLTAEAEGLFISVAGPLADAPSP